MEKQCICCGDELKMIAFTGSIGDMEIDFCDIHAEYCENCEEVKVKMLG